MTFDKKTKMKSNGLKNENHGRFYLPFGLLVLPLLLGCWGRLQNESFRESTRTFLACVTRVHFDQEGANVRLYPLIDNAKVTAVIVRVASRDNIIRDFEDHSEVEAKYSNTYCLGDYLDENRNGICCQGKGAYLSLDGHVYKFSRKALADGPWIYCFDHSKTPYRIRVPQSDQDRFESDLYGLPPQEFVSRWCDPMLGESLMNGEFIK